MFVHEFLNCTTRRNRNLQIDCRVQQRIKLYAQELEERRHQLACQLHWEDQQLQLELEELQQARADAVEIKRIETIQLSIMQKEKTEQELIEQTRFQREMYVKSTAFLIDNDNSYSFLVLSENTEDYRHMETKQILLDTKQAQLYQIEERRERRRRASYMDKQWQLS